MKGSYLGPRFENQEISQFLKNTHAPSHFLPDEDELLDKVCDAIVEEKIIGWFQGRMEFGPRALGGRSIIGDSRSENIQTQMNLSIKYRESFRPFAPSVLEEKTAEYFDLKVPSPYMLLVAPVKEKIRTVLSREDQETMTDPDLLKRVRLKRYLRCPPSHILIIRRGFKVSQKIAMTGTTA